MQQQARALGDPTRHAIFRHIATADRPLGVRELNEQFGFNHNAIRQHLAKLVAADLVVETRLRGAGRGRPRLVYEANPAFAGRWGTAGPYERLSRLLVEVIRTGLDPQEVGRRAADQIRVTSPSGDAVADIDVAMARQGFDPEVRLMQHRADIVLHDCPFSTAAIADRKTVCALHLGIAEGLTADTPVVVDELVAYDPRKADCRLRLRVAPPGAEHEVSRGTLSLRKRRPAH